MTSYGAAHRSAAVAPRGHRGVLVVRGADRLSWLQGLVTNDVAFDGPGASYAAWLTPQGRMVTDMVVIETGTETWLDVPAALADALSRRLDLLIFAEDARVEDRSSSLGSLGVYGPSAATVLREAAGTSAPTELPAPGAAWITSVTDDRLAVIAAADLGIPGLAVYGAASRVAAIADRLAEAGVPSLDAETATVLRVEAGVPAFLVDMGEETIPPEANLDRALSQTKGCYVGQEIIVRIRDRAHGRVARRLVGLLLDGSIVPATPQAVTSEGRQAGRVTSAVISPALGRPIALATLQRDFTEPGTAVVLDDGTRAVVTSLPFTS